MLPDDDGAYLDLPRRLDARLAQRTQQPGRRCAEVAKCMLPAGGKQIARASRSFENAAGGSEANVFRQQIRSCSMFMAAMLASVAASGSADAGVG